MGQAEHKEDPRGQDLSASAFGGLFFVVAEGGGSESRVQKDI